MTRKDFVVTWLSMLIIFATILVAYAFVRWLDAVMISVAIGAIFGVAATFPIWLLARAAFGHRSEVRPVERIRPTVRRCDDAETVASINGDWKVVA